MAISIGGEYLRLVPRNGFGDWAPNIQAVQEIQILISFTKDLPRCAFVDSHGLMQCYAEWSKFIPKCLV